MANEQLRRFEGMVALITGSATGIGEACAKRFAEEGADIACVDNNVSENQATAAACGASGVRAITIDCDVRADDADRVVAAVVERFGRIDILVCSAGIYTGSPLGEVTRKEWSDALEVNLTGTFLFNKAVAPELMARKSGSIINISSMAGKTSWPASFEYSASKSGVIGLTRSMAMELAPYGVTVNALCPGNTLTKMVRGVAAKVGGRDGMSADQWLAMRANDCPMKRLAEPWEMAGIVAFLASKDSRYVTGQSISADGGMVLS